MMRSQGWATIHQKEYRRLSILFSLRTSSGEEILSLVPSHHNHDAGEKLGITMAMEDLIYFSKDQQPPALSAA